MIFQREFYSSIRVLIYIIITIVLVTRKWHDSLWIMFISMHLEMKLCNISKNAYFFIIKEIEDNLWLGSIK